MWAGLHARGLTTFTQIDEWRSVDVVKESMSMATGDSDNEYEPFQVTEEEFKSKRPRMTKEDHIYGLWAEHDSDEDNRWGIR